MNMRGIGTKAYCLSIWERCPPPHPIILRNPSVLRPKAMLSGRHLKGSSFEGIEGNTDFKRRMNTVDISIYIRYQIIPGKDLINRERKIVAVQVIGPKEGKELCQRILKQARNST